MESHAPGGVHARGEAPEPELRPAASSPEPSPDELAAALRAARAHKTRRRINRELLGAEERFVHLDIRGDSYVAKFGAPDKLAREAASAREATRRLADRPVAVVLPAMVPVPGEGIALVARDFGTTLWEHPEQIADAFPLTKMLATFGLLIDAGIEWLGFVPRNVFDREQPTLIDWESARFAPGGERLTEVDELTTLFVALGWAPCYGINAREFQHVLEEACAFRTRRDAVPVLDEFEQAYAKLTGGAAREARDRCSDLMRACQDVAPTPARVTPYDLVNLVDEVLPQPLSVLAVATAAAVREHHGVTAYVEASTEVAQTVERLARAEALHSPGGRLELAGDVLRRYARAYDPMLGSGTLEGVVRAIGDRVLHAPSHRLSDVLDALAALKPSRRVPREREEMIDLTGRAVAWPEAAVHAWHRITREQTMDRFDPGDERGDVRLRDALAHRLHLDPAQFVIAVGVRAIARLLGDAPMLCEGPGFWDIAEALGPTTTLASWEEMQDAVGEPLWLTSPGRNPDGRTLTPAEAERLARARLVVQDETFRWYAPHTPRIDGAMLVGSLGKLVGTGARLAWAWGERAVHLARTPGWPLPPTAWQRAWSAFIETDAFGELVTVVVRESSAARDEFARAAGIAVTPECIGPSLLLPLSAEYSERDAVDIAHTHALSVSPGADFRAPRPSLRVCFTGLRADDAARAAARARTISFLWTERTLR